MPVKTCAYVFCGACFGAWVDGASIGDLMSARLCGVVFSVVAALEGNVASTPLLGVVYSGIGLPNASRKAGVPNVSVSAIPRTYNDRVSM